MPAARSAARDVVAGSNEAVACARRDKNVLFQGRWGSDSPRQPARSKGLEMTQIRAHRPLKSKSERTWQERNQGAGASGTVERIMR